MPPSRIGWPVKPVPPKPVPGPINPPVPPGGGTPPGPITITPWTPPGPAPEPIPPQYQSGMWSDGWCVVRQNAGSILLTLSNGNVVPFDIRRAGEQAADIVNQILGVIGLAARATTIEPWPVRLVAARKGALMADDITLADLAAQIQVLIVNSEQVNSRLSSIEEHLAGAETEQPPAPTEPEDHWAAAFGLTEEPAGLDAPLDVFTPERAALYAVFERSVINGSRTFVKSDCISLAHALVMGNALDATGQRYLDLCVKYSVDRDVAIFALLTGLVDPYEGGLGARLERDVAALAGTYKPETLSDGTVVSRWIPLTFEGAYRKLLPSGSGGQAGQGGA